MARKNLDSYSFRDKQMAKLAALIPGAPQQDLGFIIALCRRQLSLNTLEAEQIANYTGDLVVAEPSDEATS